MTRKLSHLILSVCLLLLLFAVSGALADTHYIVVGTRQPASQETPAPTATRTPGSTPSPAIIEGAPSATPAPTTPAPSATGTPEPLATLEPTPSPTPRPTPATLSPDEWTHVQVVSVPARRTATPAPTAISGLSQDSVPILVTPTPTMPVVVDRVSYPGDWRSFAFDGDAELLEVVFPPIRDCDAILLRCGGETLLIDCGAHAFENAVLEMLDETGVTRIDSILISHPHHDHWEGLSAIAGHVQVGRLLLSFPDNYNEHMPRILSAAAAADIPVERYGDGDVLTLGGATLTVYDRSPANYSCNNRSAQLLLRYGERTMLFTGDIERAGMRALTASVAEGELRADILKYPHHGKAALEMDFLRAVQPLYAVVTNKERDWDGQLWLRQKRIPYANTRIRGVRLTTDGGGHWIAERLYDAQDVRGR